MSTEGVAHANVLERIGRAALHELVDLPEDALSHPVPVPEGNSAFAIATHLVGVGEFCLLGRPSRAQSAYAESLDSG